MSTEQHSTPTLADVLNFCGLEITKDLLGTTISVRHTQRPLVSYLRSEVVAGDEHEFLLHPLHRSVSIVLNMRSILRPLQEGRSFFHFHVDVSMVQLHSTRPRDSAGFINLSTIWSMSSFQDRSKWWNHWSSYLPLTKDLLSGSPNSTICEPSGNSREEEPRRS